MKITKIANDLAYQALYTLEDLLYAWADGMNLAQGHAPCLHHRLLSLMCPRQMQAH
jgi:hypothetical protein